jgi:2-dehydro-3-deoxyphosphogluconate aldolase/(4S)-4-hydroxy-2-oxoglutarate aldolase
LQIVPTGGVDAGNIAEWFKAGCVAVGAGSSLVSSKILQDADWAELTRRAGEFVAAANASRNS